MQVCADGWGAENLGAINETESRNPIHKERYTRLIRAAPAAGAAERAVSALHCGGGEARPMELGALLRRGGEARQSGAGVHGFNTREHTVHSTVYAGVHSTLREVSNSFKGKREQERGCGPRVGTNLSKERRVGSRVAPEATVESTVLPARSV